MSTRALMWMYGQTSYWQACEADLYYGHGGEPSPPSPRLLSIDSSRYLFHCTRLWLFRTPSFSRRWRSAVKQSSRASCDTGTNPGVVQSRNTINRVSVCSFEARWYCHWGLSGSIFL
ncbi:hypothetical protein AG1IA_04054 [Rhizoctonia solani AG-1 IA]|uniref:Uncharacterized protein n=1 Tax=Thanatephorus cucumeris (strain AG1-IA) TaxID=983506 RepID=L8WZY3_THACA|nr:hypothetical protein AG1IA_04054 [Rhizoctonia solani AG-1 IA]